MEYDGSIEYVIDICVGCGISIVDVFQQNRTIPNKQKINLCFFFNFVDSFWCLNYYRSAAKRLNIFYRMPTTSDRRIGHPHQTPADYSLLADGQNSKFPIMAYAYADYMVMQRDHNRIRVWHFHRWHSNRTWPALPSDSIYPKCYRIVCLSVYYISWMPEWNAFSASPPIRWPHAIGPPSMMVPSISMLMMLSYRFLMCVE